MLWEFLMLWDSDCTFFSDLVACFDEVAGGSSGEIVVTGGEMVVTGGETVVAGGSLEEETGSRLLY